MTGKNELRAEFFAQWCAWWIVASDGLQSKLLYGPFFDDEIELAKAIHGIG